MTPRKPLPIPEICAAYAAGGSLRKIGKRYGVSQETIRKLLIGQGVSTRANGRVAKLINEVPLRGDDFTSFRMQVQNFLKRHDMSDRMFGVLALNKPNFVFEMRRGVESLPRTVRRVRDWMRTYNDRETAA